MGWRALDIRKAGRLGGQQRQSQHSRASRRAARWFAGVHPKRSALTLGCLAAASMGLVNVLVACTAMTNGTATPDTRIAPSYRSSVSVSVSASKVTSSSRESSRQQSVTTAAVRTVCDSFGTTSKDAIAKSNQYVEAANAGRATGPFESPAIDSLNNSATTVAGGVNDMLSQQLKDALNSWVDAARAVANAIATHAATSEFNRRVNQLNDTKTNANKQCMAAE
jgi:hypothetical protein